MKDNPDPVITADQKERRERSEKIISKRKIKINQHLPYIESEEETTIRSAEEVAQRLVVLTAVNLVAFDNFTGEEITSYLKEFDLWDYTTPKEKEFLRNPTDEAKSNETWKVEGIWTLIWALNIVDDLGFPDEEANLNNVPSEDYPFGGLDVDPNGFIQHYTDIRSKQEIIDAADLYYRIDWACVDERINGRQLEQANQSVVYERHYALNWLINYMDQDWDHISCDT